MLSAALVLMTLTAAAEQPVNIGGVSYEKVDSFKFTEAPRGPENQAPLVPTNAEQRAGMVLYFRGDPGAYRPWSVPVAKERLEAVSVFGFHGQTIATWAGIYALDSLRRVRIRVDPPPGVTTEVRIAHFWPQRLHRTSKQFYIIPELLLPYDDGQAWRPWKDGILQPRDLDVPGGKTELVWLSVKVDGDAPSGVREGRLVFQAEGRPEQSVPLRVRVIPVALRRPAHRQWLMFADSIRWRQMSDGQVLAELRDFAAHGMTGLAESPLGELDLSRMRDGEVSYDASEIKRIARLGSQAGLRGPHIIHVEVEKQVAEALGLRVDLLHGDWPPEVRAGVERVARTVAQTLAAEKIPWYYFGHDEPSPQDTRSLQEYRCWQAGGARTFATAFQPGFFDRAWQHLSAACHSLALVDDQWSCDKTRGACQRGEVEFWWHGSGTYPAQESCLFLNRYPSGALFWRTGAAAEVSWTFMRPHGDPFNDFDGSEENRNWPKDCCTCYPWFEKPRDWSTYKGAIPTLAWEALREGVDDYRMLFTLEELTAERLGSGSEQQRARARQGRELLSALREGLPWKHETASIGFDNAALRRVRRVVAREIAALVEPKASSPPSPSVTLKLSAESVPAPAGSPLHLLTIPVMPSAPQAAAPLPPFVRAATGEPSPVITEARVGRDSRALYVAFRCVEPLLDAMNVTHFGHDADGTWRDDGVTLYVDPTGEGRRCGRIIVTPGGVSWDGVGEDRKAWDPKTETAGSGRRLPGGYVVEIALPWAELAPLGRVPSAAIGLNLARTCNTTRVDDRHTAWAPTFSSEQMPERLGAGLLQDGGVTLVSAAVSGTGNERSVAVTLANRTGEARRVRAEVQPGGGAAEGEVAAGATEVFRVPAAGWASHVALTWESPGIPAARIPLAIGVPGFLTVDPPMALLAPGETAEITLRAHAAALCKC